MSNLLMWLGRKTGRKEPISMFLISWFSLAETLVTLVTFGFCCPHWRSWALFCWDWLEDFNAKYNL